MWNWTWTATSSHDDRSTRQPTIERLFKYIGDDILGDDAICRSGHVPRHVDFERKFAICSRGRNTGFAHACNYEVCIH